jgi:hypothetical protein
MADKKAKPAASTPAQSYPDPYWPGSSTGPNMFSNAPPMTLGANGIDFNPQGGMANTPRPGWGMNPEQQQVTPNANAAAARAYTRNAPYMQDFMSDPQAMVQQMYMLQQSLEKDPTDVVSEYRLRVLRQALGDVFGMRVPEQIYGYGVTRAQAPATPGSPYGSSTTPGSK